MDLDFFGSSNQAQMELVSMMMQMEKLPEFHNSIIDFSSGSCGSSQSPPPAFTSSPMVSPSSTISFRGAPLEDHHHHQSVAAADGYSGGAGAFSDPGADKRASMVAMREMIFRIAAMQPIHIDPESVKPPKRRNVKISKDPQSVAARHRRERISERIRILQRLVPGGTKMDTASMLDEAIHYVKFLKTQVQSLERVAVNAPHAQGQGQATASSPPYDGSGYQCFRDMYQHLYDDLHQQQQQYTDVPTQMFR